jgi:hypothetical protein
MLSTVKCFWFMEPNFCMLMWMPALLQMWFMLMLLSRNYPVSCGLLLMFGRFGNTVICLKACVGIAMWGLWTWRKLCCHIVLYKKIHNLHDCEHLWFSVAVWVAHILYEQCWGLLCRIGPFWVDCSGPFSMQTWIGMAVCLARPPTLHGPD